MLINSKSNIANLAILGASGYTGAESIRLLMNNVNYKIINLFEKSLLFYNEPIELVISNKEVVSGVFRGINKDGSLKL